jgi:cell division protein FtsL
MAHSEGEGTLEASELQIEFERLQVDKRAQATPLRVEKLARDKLKMFDNSPARTHYVALSESGQVLSSSPAKVQEVAP